MTKGLLFAGLLLLSTFTLQTFSSQADLHKAIVLNEIEYNPRGPEVEGEWIELFNSGESTNIDNWTITDQDGWIFQFPSLAVPRECYIVLHIGPGIPDSDFSDCVAHLFANEQIPRLNNDGDDLLLRDGQGTAIDFFSYGSGGGLDHPPSELNWGVPAQESLEGYSISVFPNGCSSDSQENWIQSNPTPGRTNGELSDVSTYVKISEVYYNAYRDNEFVALRNLSPVEMDISGWQITDLEGRIAFPPHTVIPSYDTFWVAENSTSFLEDSLFQANFRYVSGLAQAMIPIGSPPLLNNEGDEVLLLDDHGRVVDAFIYGYSTYEGAGWKGRPAYALARGLIAKRHSDTNTSTDWEGVREYRLGQSDFKPELITFEGKVRAFSSPDTSFNTILQEINDARKRIAISMYDLTSRRIGEALVSALARGVDLRILLDGSPVGGIQTEEKELLDILLEAGGHIRFLKSANSTDPFHRYAFNHGKYALIDDKRTIICSENWGDSGIPEDTRMGNRGWCILLESEEVKDYFGAVFENDWNPSSRDSIAYEEVMADIIPAEGRKETLPAYEYVAHFPSRVFSGIFRVRPVLSPDTSLDSSTVLGMIRSAVRELLVEQFYIHSDWGDDSSRNNPFLEAIVDAARRGVNVYVLLDSSWYNTNFEDKHNNDDVVAYLNQLGEEGLPIKAKLIDSNSHGFLKLHNKGLIADQEVVLISSINWNKNSIISNREVGIIIYNQNIASFYRDLFFYDWKDDVTPPLADAGGNKRVLLNEKVRFDATRSHDDIAIVNFSWDVDGDGLFERFGAVVEEIFTEIGTHNVTLMVKDAWGNTATDTCLVRVEPLEAEKKDEPDERWGGLVLMTIVTLSITIPSLFFLTGNRRQKDLKKG